MSGIILVELLNLQARLKKPIKGSPSCGQWPRNLRAAALSFELRDERQTQSLFTALLASPSGRILDG